MRNFLPNVSLRHPLLLALATLFMTLTSAAASHAAAGDLASAAAEPRFSEEAAYRAVVDPSELERPVLSLSNPYGDRSITLRVFAWSTRIEGHRTHVLHLEAGGTSTMTFDGPLSFDRLAIRSAAPFLAELESAADGRRQMLQVEARDGKGSFNKFGFSCSGDWTLTCLNCSHGPFTAPGFVIPIGNVYWKQNRPAVNPWETIGDQGITATWQHASDCPVSVTNSLGDTYSVYID